MCDQPMLMGFRVSDEGGELFDEVVVAIYVVGFEEYNIRGYFWIDVFDELNFHDAGKRVHPNAALYHLEPEIL